MLVEQTYLSIAVTSILILLGNIVMLKKPFVGCILRAAGFALATILIQGPNIFAETLIVASSVTGITLSFYTYSYSRNKYGDLALTPLTDVLLLSMIILFQAKTLIEFIGFWLLTELIAFFLIAYEYIVKGDAQSIRAAIKYLIVSMIPTDLSLFIMLGLAGFEEALTRPLMEFNLGLQNPAILSTVILGFFSKAAVIPLHFWLPDAHSIAPSPASALLSGLMVKMGVYGLYLLSLQQLDKLLASLTMVLLGGLTAIYGAIQVLVQEDIKRFLAYSTISETGLISLLIGLYIFSGDNIFLVSSIAYSVAHALYKTLMFMDAGYIEVVAHTRSIRGLGFIHRLSPLQTTSILMNIASYLGMPPSTGFLAKLTIFTAITKHITHSHIYIIVLLITVVKVMISVIYNGVYLKTHFGKEPLSNIANTYQSGDDLMLNMSCLVSSVYTYIITIPLLYLLIYEGGFAEVKYLRTLLPFAVVLTIISLLLYLLIYKTIKRERDDAKSFYTPNFSYANRFLGLYAILVFSITLVLGITNKDLMLLEAGFK
ncbi:MAG: complex I subunit 5 family protein, partial [Ignisphaera sp.]